MNAPLVRACAVVLAALAFVSGLAAEPRWKIEFFYDHADSNFNIEDLECPTAQHCVAAGVIDDKNGHQRGAVVVTVDAGRHWSQYEVKERPIALFFLNDNSGWMATDRGLWSTAVGGRDWTKVTSRKGILQTWFLDPNHGYIAGLQGLVQETNDGGKNWVNLEVSAQVPNAKSVNYDIASFQGMHGYIIGAADSPSPFLVNPRSPVPAGGKLTVLETVDGGRAWKYGTMAVDGELAQLRISKDFAATLILYSDPKAKLGSAVFKMSWGSADRVMFFGDRNRAASDFLLLSGGGVVVVAVEPPGNSARVPIPGKLKILKSANLQDWQEMDVDYRAVAQRAVIAAPDDRHMWVATDTGAILGLVE